MENNREKMWPCRFCVRW